MTFSYYTEMEFVNVNEVTGYEGMSARAWLSYVRGSD
jgi:hypothetical protein